MLSRKVMSNEVLAVMLICVSIGLAYASDGLETQSMERL
jgi:hypothetical protein